MSIPLEDGVNEIILKVTDEFGNIAEESYFITYAKPVEIKVVDKPVVIEVPIENKTVEVVQENILNQDSKYGWIWILFWILVLSVFLWYFVFNENRLKERITSLYKKNKKARPENSPYAVRRHKDEILHKHVQRTKIERHKRHSEIIEQKRRERIKPVRELSPLEKRKMEDMDHKRNRDIFHERRTPHKREISKEHKPATLKIPKFFTKKKKGDMGNDPFSNYLKKQSIKYSWNSSNHYRQSYYEKLKKEELERQRKIEEEKKLLQLEIQEEQEIKRKQQEKKRKENDIKHGLLKKNKLDLDDYLSSRTKKKRRFYFAQSEVEKDIKKRDN